MKKTIKIIVAAIISLALLTSIALGGMHVLAVKEFGADTRIGRIELAGWSTSDHIVVMSPFCDGEDIFLLVWDCTTGYVFSDGFYGFWNNY